MAKSAFDVVVIGGGAAGIAAARRLADARIDCLLVEARSRLGGRAFTSPDPSGTPLDLGCGWLHSADRNPWAEIAGAQGRTIDRTPPPWMRPSTPIGFPLEEQKEFRAALLGFHQRIGDFPETGPDAAAATLLEQGNRWNPLIGAVSTYLSGTEPDRYSARDFTRYDDSGVNWRVVEGYGTAIAGHAAGVAVKPGCAVKRVDLAGRRLGIETSDGMVTASAAVVTLPSNLIADEAIRFNPALPDKIEAAAGLPLGLADKLFLSLEGAEEFETESRLFGRTDRTGIGAYHFRPFRRPMIEAYFGGLQARELERGGEAAFLDFALGELTGLLGSGFARRVKPISMYMWATDPYARGSYSYAMPGKADCRCMLAAPVDGRLFFAGEACSVNDYSTAHGAYRTGTAAADQVIAALRGRETAIER